jgi:RNA polymerase sigma-70 factor (ECF subfamily)
MQPTDPDVRLMLAFRDGDEAALPALYARWAARLLRYLERIVRDPAVAEELLQETFIRVLDARARYAPDARFSTWLFHIARNLALNELGRARSRHPHVSADFTVGATTGAERGEPRPTLALVANGLAPDDHADARRAHDRFARAFGDLPERQQTALWLAVVEGHAYDEIAGVLGTSVQSVKNLVHRARATLADRLGEADRSGAAEERR